MNRISTNQLTQSGLQFVAEVSDLGPNFNLERVYDDAMDLGFVLESAKTGAEVTMVLTEECHDNDGDLTHLKFEPTKQSIRHLPSWATQIRVTLFND